MWGDNRDHSRLCLSVNDDRQTQFFLFRCSRKGLTFWRIRIELQIAPAEIAQLVEHAAENRSVRSSILRLGIGVFEDFFEHTFFYVRAAAARCFWA